MGISPSASRVAWYRFRCTLPARWSGYLALTLLLGLVWGAFARQISVVPAPAVPSLIVTLIAVGALAFANLVAVWPGRLAGRTPVATLLRAE